MNCPVCGELLQFDQHARRYVCPRCDFFKNPYRSEWKRHRDNVNKLLDEIKLRYPIVSFKMGLGATTGDWVDIPPERKNEADIEVWWRVHIISIEVTGSAKVKVPPESIWILAKKLPVAMGEINLGRDYIFYASYSSGDFVIPAQLVYKHNRDIKILSKAGSERYIEIPPSEALPGKELFTIIGDKLWRLMS